MAENIRATILRLIAKRGMEKTICPSEVARELWPDNWRPYMADVRHVAEQMARAEEIVILQRGKKIELKPGVGPIRLGAVTTPLKRPLVSTPRLGLCCQFAEYPCKFRTTTASSLIRMKLEDRQLKLSEICLFNSQSLLQALQFCAQHGIGCFRILSTILPLKTHPQVGYSIDELPHGESIIDTFRQCGLFAVTNNIRTVFHPDQFVVLNSPRQDVVDKAVTDLEYHDQVCE